MAYLAVFALLCISEFVSYLGVKLSFVYAGKLYFCLVFLVLVLFAGFRSPGIDPDYYNYVDWLHSVSQDPSLLMAQFKDPGFSLVYLLTNFLGVPDVIFFAIIAYLSLQAKALFSTMALDGAWKYHLFFLICARFYIVHDLIQIRVGAAISIVSCALILVFNGRRFFGLMLYVLALSFHLSVIIFAPIFLLLVLGFRGLNRFWLLIIPLASFLMSGAIVILSSQLSSFARLAPYINGDYKTSALPLFSVYFLARLILLSFILAFLHKRLTELERYYVFMSIIGLSVQALLSWNDSLSLRFSELFGLFDMACFMMIVRFFDKKSQFFYAAGLVVLAGVLYFSSLKLIGDYAFTLS